MEVVAPGGNLEVVAPGGNLEVVAGHYLVLEVVVGHSRLSSKL